MKPLTAPGEALVGGFRRGPLFTRRDGMIGDGAGDQTRQMWSDQVCELSAPVGVNELVQLFEDWPLLKKLRFERERKVHGAVGTMER